jgi:hypothetical protein
MFPALISTRSSMPARSGAPVDGRVSPRAGGVSPDTWLAETAQTAQTSRTSMKWASAQGRAVPAQTAQTAETSLRSRRRAKAAAPKPTGQRRAVCRELRPGKPACPGTPGQPIKMLWTHSGGLEKHVYRNHRKSPLPRQVPQRLAVQCSPDRKPGSQAAIKINPWGIDLTENTNEMKTASEITEIPKFRRPLSLVWYAPQVQQRLIAGSAALRAAHGLCSR